MERAVVEGALEAARKDGSRLQGEVATLRATLRRGGTIDAPVDDLAASRRTKVEGKFETKAENVEPILKS